jgi:hypothetical protein
VSFSEIAVSVFLVLDDRVQRTEQIAVLGIHANLADALDP